MKMKKRRGFSLLDVALAAVVLIIGTMGMGKFYNSIYSQLTPTGSWGGLRRYLIAEEMLRAQAEGLRVLHDIPITANECKLVTEPPNLGYSLVVNRTSGPPDPNEQMYYFDIDVFQAPLDPSTHLVTTNPQQIGSLSMSTVRAIGTLGGTDGKIGL